jgi:single-strand DNA-binding protein
MANLNKVMLIGRLTRDPECRTFANGGKVAAFGFAVNNKRKNQQTGAWEDEPVFLDCKAFNRDSGRKLADLVEQFFAKGKQFFLEGHLKMEEWVGKEDGQKRNKLVVILDDFQFFEPKADGQTGGGYSRPTQQPAPQRRPPAQSAYQDSPPMDDYQETPEFAEHPNDKEIPF